jgi:glycosyltransferase involved in cell wall biosynthesis
MVWSGPCWDEKKLVEWRSLWGARGSQVHITGSLPKPHLYSVLQQAEAAVLPSQVDNLPNTVIESLMFGVPVLGTSGASIDELVAEGCTGHLVPLGDERALGEVLARMWHGKSPVHKGFVWRSKIADEMQPSRAISNLLAVGKSSVPSERRWNYRGFSFRSRLSKRTKNDV